MLACPSVAAMVISNEEVANGHIPMGRVLRDRRPKSAQPAVVNGYPNIYAATAYPGGRLIPFDSGINVIAPIKAVDTIRIPAIIIASNQIGRAHV